MAGTGLPVWALAALIASSSALFLLWGGPLWRAPRDASHVARFAVSYLAVIPAAALLLALWRSFRASHLVAACAVSWAAKMLITALLYNAVAPGTAISLEPREAPSAPAPAPSHARYRPAGGRFASGALEGTVRFGDRPVRATLALLHPPPGLPPAQPPLELAVRGSAYVTPFAVAHLRSPLTARNEDAVLHTLRLSPDGRLEATFPLPPSAAAVPVAIPRAGLYRLSCANHRSENGWLLVLDHPYLVQAGADGRFRMDSVPAGALTLAALSLQSEGLWRSVVEVEVRAGETREVSIDLEAAGHALAVAMNPEEATR